LGYITVAESLGICFQPLLRSAPKATKFAEITQNNGHYAIQGHSMSPILVPIECSYTTSYWLILTYLLSCIVSET